MQLIRLWAMFGGLRGRELTLQPGLNLIEAPNEAGKSTWSAFIRAMFFGIRSSERSKNGSVPDKIKYQPWTGEAMEGLLELEWQGERLSLHRQAPGVGKPMGACTTTYTQSGERIPALCGGSVGEALLGVPESVFRRSAFLSGTELAVDADGELEKRILSLVSTGEEGSSCREAEERLRRWQRGLRWHSSGMLPEAEERLAELRAALGQIEAESRRLAGLREERDALLGKKERLGLALRLIRRDEQLAARQRWEAAEREAQEAEALLLLLQRELAGHSPADGAKLRMAAERLREAEVDAAEGAALLRKAREELAALPEAKASKPQGRLFWLPPVLGVLLLAVSILLRRELAVAFRAALLALGLLGISAGPLCFRARRQDAALEKLHMQRREQAARRTEELERQQETAAAALLICRSRLIQAKRSLGFSEQTDALKAAGDWEQRFRYMAEQEKAAAAARRLADALRPAEEPEALEGKASLSREEAERQLGETEQALLVAEQQLARAEGGLNRLGDPLVLATEEQGLLERIQRGERRYAAQELALTVLQEAGHRLQTALSPLLSREASALLSRLTGGRYTSLFPDQALRLSVGEAGAQRAYPLEYLSEGTKSQVYLALRLALCHLVLPQKEPCPIILDDALLSLDDERAAGALELLLELAKERQIILLSCQHRETALMQDREGVTCLRL